MKKSTKNLVLASLFLAMGWVLPFLTGQLQALGRSLLPMHIPVLLCGLICGWRYGLLVGLITPLLRSVMLGMPPFYPIAIAMAFELAAYGLVSGILFDKLQNKRGRIIGSLVGAMIAGRLVWGLVSFILFNTLGKGFTLQMFLAGGFINAVPGIAVQIIIIPLIVVALERTGILENE